MVANCTLRAPRDGIVVYANQSDLWGRAEAQIQEGVTVRQNQAIINLPDPNHMQVRARVNESKISMIREGQKAHIRIDAFPDRPLTGTVESVTAMPAPTSMAGQDVRVYYATVEIDTGGFDELRPGLSAEVTFLVDQPRSVVRVPLQAVHWVNNTAYVAVVRPPSRDGTPTGPAWEWRTPVLGESDTNYFEVRSGLEPGERVVARPDLLPTPKSARPAPSVAAESRPGDRPRG
jgi:multidrug efflux pump subunit AcrA (membrane-fusion protein)